jgi:hypothetical protein
MEKGSKVLIETYFLAASSFFFLLFRTMKTRAKRTIVGRNGAYEYHAVYDFTT